MKMFKKVLALFCSVLLTLLCGCKGYRETNQGLFVTAICFEGVEEGYSAAIEIIYSLENESGTQREVLHTSAATPALCMASFKSSLSRQLYFEHCGVIIIDEYSTDSQITQVIDYCKQSEVNLSSFLAIAPDTQQLLEASSFSGNTGFDIMTLMKKVRSENGINFSNRIYEIGYSELNGGKSTIPRLSVKQGKISISGERIYRKGNEKNDKAK